jgi:hypothetical protein
MLNEHLTFDLLYSEIGLSKPSVYLLLGERGEEKLTQGVAGSVRWSLTFQVHLDESLPSPTSVSSPVKWKK